MLELYLFQNTNYISICFMHSVTFLSMSMVTALHAEIFIKLPSSFSDVEFIKLVGRVMDETKGSKN